MEDEQELLDMKRTLKTSYILKRIFGYLRPQMKLFILAMVLYVLEAFMAAVEPQFIGKVIDLVSEGAPYKEVALYGWLYAIIITLNYCVFSFIAGLVIQLLAQNIIVQMRQDLFDHIQSLSIDQLHSVPVGKWVNRVTNDVNAVMSFFSDVLVQIIYNFIYLVAIIVFVFVTNWKLAFIDLAFLPVISVVAVFFAKYSRKHYREVRSSFSSMNGFLSENLSGMETIQVFNQEERKMEQFSSINKSIKKASWGAVRVFAIFRPLIYLLYVSALIAVFGAGLPMVASGTITIGIMYSFYQYTQNMFNPIQNIANQFNGIQSALAGAERVIKILDMPSQIIDSPDAQDIGKIKGKVEFRHVYFAYKGEEWILKDVSFIINPGDTVAFVGETGAGKSTIINLMCRNFDIQKGEILIDDIPLRNISISSLRRNIGEMLQDVFLFSGTIKDNISLGDETISQDDIEKACAFVGADGFIQKLPQKLDEPVNENGNNFSQGQRQLISFARAVAYKPSLIVLDEATANIDTETEVIIQSSLEKIKSIGTMVMVAHRLSTIRHATMIYVVDHGVITEQGNHQALLKKRGIYYNLYKLQTMEKEMAAQPAEPVKAS